MTKKTFGERIRELREAKQVSLRKFAQQLEISATYLSKIERGDLPPPGEDAVMRIARSLDQDPDQLLALAGKVASDLPELIRERPKPLSILLRATRNLTAEQIAKLTEEAERMQRSRNLAAGAPRDALTKFAGTK
jgi:HTH-type transcriptional regulator, competence development regulator